MPAVLRSHSPIAQGLATGLADLKMEDLSHPHAHFSHHVDVLEPRDLRNSELWKLYNFETHAFSCPSCNDPYHVHRRGSRLCRTGHKLAQDVATIIYSQTNATAVFSRTKSVNNQLVRVNIPTGYDQIISLLRAMERSLRHRSQSPIVSYDRNYFVPERPVTRRSSLHAPRTASPRRVPSQRAPRARDDPRRSVVGWPQRDEVATSTRQPSASANPTNYAPPSVEDADEIAPVAPSSTPQPRPQPTRAAPDSAAGTPRQRHRDQAQPTSSPRRQATAPPPNVLPEAPEPPVTTERPPPTEFAYSTSIRQPPPSSFRQPRRQSPPSASRRRHSGLW